jgi:hypothetical protein
VQVNQAMEDAILPLTTQISPDRPVCMVDYLQVLILASSERLRRDA